MKQASGVRRRGRDIAAAVQRAVQAFMQGLARSVRAEG
jgi:hypothetical protein